MEPVRQNGFEVNAFNIRAQFGTAKVPSKLGSSRYLRPRDTIGNPACPRWLVAQNLLGILADITNASIYDISAL
jgi:hypothetical protein